MEGHNISIEDKEKMFFSSIRNEIEGMVDTKLHSLYVSHPGIKIDSNKVEEECQMQFFDGLSKMFESSIKICGEFYEQLKLDDAELYGKVQSGLAPISEKVVHCQSVRDLLELKQKYLSKEDEKKIYSIGLKHFKEEHFEAAYLYFSFLSLLDAENAHIWLARGMVEQNLGKHQEALGSYASSLSLAPGHLVTYIQIMDTLLLMKHFDEAHRVYETFMREVNPDSYSRNAFILSKLNVVRSFLTQAAA